MLNLSKDTILFRIYNYFHEIFKFRDFMNTSRNFAKSVFARTFVKLCTNTEYIQMLNVKNKC